MFASELNSSSGTFSATPTGTLPRHRGSEYPVRTGSKPSPVFHRRPCCGNGSIRAPGGARTGAAVINEEPMSGAAFAPGAVDLEARAAVLAHELTDGLKPLARVAYNYRWSWTREGEDVFRDIHAHRWELSGGNPVRFLADLWPSTQAAAEQNPELLERVEALVAKVEAGSRGAGAAAARDRRAGRLHVRRVRLPPVDADLLGRPRRARRRHPQGGERPGARHDRDRAPVPARLLPPAPRHHRAPAGVLDRRRSPRPADGAGDDAGRRPAPARGAAVRRPAAVPGLAGRRRPDPAAPARRRAALERRGAAVDLGAAVRGEPRRAARAVRAARDRRRARAPGARDRPRP